GEMVVSDAETGVQYLVDKGLADPKRVAIRGGSAGGFATLLALATSKTFTAGTSLYGIADLAAMVKETHKFESHYIGRLVGSSDLSDPIWAEKSPINHIENIAAPLLLLQGSEDRVVPPSQALMMKDALEKLGRTVELKIYEGEGHGFVRSDTIQDALLTELDFYKHAWGIASAK
uniref:alpha/beta hydrolase family protein n=1 Tax=uncultured Actinomyces sp. TaxID=249061 RepID=UPI00261DB93B